MLSSRGSTLTIRIGGMNVTAQPEQYLLELKTLMSRIIAAIIGLVRKIRGKKHP